MLNSYSAIPLAADGSALTSDPGEFLGRLAEFQADQKARFGEVSPVAALALMDSQFRSDPRFNEKAHADAAKASGLTTDAIASGVPVDLATRYSRTLIEQPYAALDWVDSLPQAADPTPPGVEYSRYFEMTRKGSIARVRAGEEAPSVNVAFDSELRPIAHYWSVVEATMFEESSSFNGPIPSILNSALVAQRNIHMEAYNVRLVNGDQDIYGVFTHPGIPRQVRSVVYSASATTGQSIIEDFGDAVTSVNTDTKGVFNARNIWMSNRLRNKLKTKPYSSLDSTPVLETLEDTYGAFTPSWQLDNIVSGYDAIVISDNANPLALRRDLVQAPTLIPVQRSGVTNKYFMFHSDAGVKCFQRAATLIVLIPNA